MDIFLRPATSADVPEIVAMLADDALGAGREDPSELGPYHAAFARFAEDPNQRLLVAEENGEVVGSLQLAILFGLSRQGASRALIEAVRVRSDRRGAGVGSWLVREAVELARREGCALVQLTSDASRADAHRFYERLGFRATHVGFKLAL
ncbi:GNAT family N-acetyltransferase [Streptomyces sp. 3MP-14]|uniref:GNAT family N-acetyltransferase n=1 Tax=Streptomyces mimosae TaxID=2586635 RepID=A0A5N6A5R7_9ACTN|nr:MULTISPECIES: GNAT family N-acetyltransferase [Streptomyces]KAB8163299.1 GNAT family N-acetyltransferase [Streptomyces mimosae]KAB8174576.1 GNAT family N-acetyltransferase [Streptomyces sp. 3MP-14]